MTDECPVCGEEYNHYIPNGYRNSWPLVAKIAVCTPFESDEMYVHVVDSDPIFPVP